MQDVAESAGMARSTVYRYFPGRDDLLVATIKREMEQLNTRIRQRLAKYSDPADQVVEGMLLAIKEVPRLRVEPARSTPAGREPSTRTEAARPV